MRIETRAGIDHVDVEHRVRTADPHLDGIALVKARVPHAVGHDLAHEEHRVVHQRIVQRGPQGLEAPACVGRRSSVRPQTDVDLEGHTGAVPKTRWAANPRSAGCSQRPPVGGAGDGSGCGGGTGCGCGSGCGGGTGEGGPGGAGSGG